MKTLHRGLHAYEFLTNMKPRSMKLFVSLLINPRVRDVIAALPVAAAENIVTHVGVAVLVVSAVEGRVTLATARG